MNRNSLKALEFEAIRRLLAASAGSARGRERLALLEPQTDVDVVREAQALTSEARRLLDAGQRQPYADLPDLRPVLAACRAEGAILATGQLLDAAAFAAASVEIARCIARGEGVPRLSRLASEVADTSGLAAAIRDAILPSGDVADTASPRLAELRRRLVRLRASLHSVMESYLHDPVAGRLLQDRLVTTRNERFVLLVKSEHRGQLPGIIHGSSGSGASLFVEPMPAVDLNNDIVAAGEDEQREVRRILRALTDQVRDQASALEAAAERLGALDAAQACALLAQDMDAVAPQIVAPGEAAAGIVLRRARHPLLSAALCERLGVERRSTREPVPVSVELTSDALVISGPNTGGKTVALKTLGLLALMAQSGLHIPAANGSRLPVFRRVFADIGDDQSISENLSTFSSHLAQIVTMTRELALPALVLLDEVGAGTDPEQGGALGVAVVEHFRARGATVVATTHHGLMKAYAESTPGVARGSFGYDPTTYEPTYVLTPGRVGRSLALEMAERLGLPESVVRDARSRLDAKQVQAQALLAKLEEDREDLAARQRELDELRRENDARQVRLREAELDIERRKRSEAQAFKAELRHLEAELRQRLDRVLLDAVKRLERSRGASSSRSAGRARSAAIAAARAVIDEAANSLLGVPPAPDSHEIVAQGDRVRVGEIGIVGEVLSVHDERVELAVSGKRMTVPVEAVRRVAGPAPSRGGVAHPGITLPETHDAPGEINLVGLRVDEALPRVDKALDDAARAERSELRVVHGFGQGRLRRAVAELLHDHPHVAGFRSGGPGEGGGGVTVVSLKS